MAEKPGIMVNPVLFLLVVGLGVLFVAALLYQIFANR